jgi:hypothetical protein
MAAAPKTVYDFSVDDIYRKPVPMRAWRAARVTGTPARRPPLTTHRTDAMPPAPRAVPSIRRRPGGRQGCPDRQRCVRRALRRCGVRAAPPAFRRGARHTSPHGARAQRVRARLGAPAAARTGTWTFGAGTFRGAGAHGVHPAALPSTHAPPLTSRASPPPHPAALAVPFPQWRRSAASRRSTRAWRRCSRSTRTAVSSCWVRARRCGVVLPPLEGRLTHPRTPAPAPPRRARRLPVQPVWRAGARHRGADPEVRVRQVQDVLPRAWRRRRRGGGGPGGAVDPAASRIAGRGSCTCRGRDAAPAATSSCGC